MKGRLFLIPTLLADQTEQVVLPPSIPDAIREIRHFLCENVRTARRYVSSLRVHENIEAIHFELLDKDTAEDALPHLFRPAMEGHDIGVLSESGCPGIADPGASAVRYAHDNGLTVVPLVGPSSVLLALMASGLNGQRFAFHGYLPVDGKEAGDSIRKLELESRQKNQTQVFIETPYRNNGLLAHLLKNLRQDSRLCVACNLTAADEKIISRPVGGWIAHPVTFPKAPAVFLFLAAP